MLARGKTLGKKTNVFFNPPTSVGTPTNSPLNMLEIKGEDEYALPLLITIAPPKYFPVIGSTITADNIQDASGTIGNQDVDNDTPSWANPFVELQWGIGGHNTEAKVDILNGLCVNINASWVRIRGGIESILADTTSIRGYELAAFVGPGMPKQPNAQRTVQMSAGLNDTVASAVRAVPLFAKRVSVFATPDSATGLFACQVDFFRDSLGTAGTQQNGRVFLSGNNPQPVPIPNGSYYFQVTNLSGEHVARVQSVFELAI